MHNNRDKDIGRDTNKGMDKIDQNLLTALDQNPRIALSKLAKRLRVSQQVLDYRLRRMIKEGKITKLAAIVNLKALGLEHYRIFFSFHSKKNYSASDVFSYLKSRKGIYWAAKVGGRYDLVVVLFVKDFEGFDKFIDEFNATFPGLIKDHKACYVTEHRIYRHKYFCEDKICPAISYGYNEEIANIDELDKYILDKLKDNCRISALELSSGMPKKSKVSYKTVINRIKALEKNKVILGYRPYIKSEKEKPYIVLLSFKDYSRESEKSLTSYLGSRKEITQLARLFGVWNLFIHVRIEDNEKLQQLIVELRDKFDIIDDYEIIPVFEDIAINLMPC